jgi:hypothetical protein
VEPELFIDSKVKIKRANHFIDELKLKFNEFLNTEFYRFNVKKDVTTGKNILQFQMVNPVPDEIRSIIGNAIHNLRASLDLMMCELATKAGGTPSNRLYFPFSKTRQDLESNINGGR